MNINEENLFMMFSYSNFRKGKFKKPSTLLFNLLSLKFMTRFGKTGSFTIISIEWNPFLTNISLTQRSWKLFFPFVFKMTANSAAQTLWYLLVTKFYFFSFSLFYGYLSRSEWFRFNLQKTCLTNNVVLYPL